MNYCTTAYTFIKRVHFSNMIVYFILLAGLLSVPQVTRADNYVVTNSDNNGSGSLRQAISDANNNSGVDTITFAVTTDGMPIVLTGTAGEDLNAGGDLDILNGGALLIQGNGATNTIIDGNGTDRIFHICPGGGCSNAVAFSDMTIQNGNVTGGVGGAIYNEAGTTTVFESTVKTSTASYGGGIYNNNNATLYIKESSLITGNSASSNGGGITNSYGTVTVDNSNITDNTATWNGGGIHNWGGTLTVQQSNINGVVTGNTAFDGAGIYNGGGGGTILDSSTVSNGEADNDGGGIYNADGSEVIIDNSTVRRNIADNDGGGIFNSGSMTTLQIKNGSTIGGTGVEGNTASRMVGGVCNESFATTTVDKSIVSANHAAGGGGVYNLAILNVRNGSTIGGSGAGNSAVEGGGIKTMAGTTTIDDSSVSANTANFGGGILNNSILIVQNSSTIGGPGEGNTGGQIGGGIYNFRSSGVTTVDGSFVCANTAETGGGIYNDLGTLNIQNDSAIGLMGAGNLATTNDGGGIYNKTGTTTVDNSSVSDNTAAGAGGGIYNEDTLYVQNGSVIGEAGAGNTAANGSGGGIYNESVVATVDNSTVSANKAVNGGGGGIFNAAVLYVQNGSTIGGAGVGNVATGYGGGIANNHTGMTTVTGSRILNNSATNGGGVYSDRNAAGATSVTGSCIVGNSATSFFNNQPPYQIGTGNWWGAATGPNTSGADTASVNITVSGYLTAPILGCSTYVCLPPILMLLLN